MSILHKILSYYYLARTTGLREALRIYLQIEVKRVDIVEHRYRKQTIYLKREDTTVWAIQHSLKKLEKLVAEIPASPSVVLDVGANCGLFTVFLKHRFPEVRVYAFEPSPSLRAVLVKNLERFDGVEIVAYAVSDVDDQMVSLYVNEKNQETNSLIAAAAQTFATREGTIVVEVPTIRLDTFATRAGLEHIDVLKVDIQGGEGALLRGAGWTLRNTARAFFEITFLDSDVFDTVDLLRTEFPLFKTLNPVQYGADILFYRSPRERP